MHTHMPEHAIMPADLIAVTMLFHRTLQVWRWSERWTPMRMGEPVG